MEVIINLLSLITHCVCVINGIYHEHITTYTTGVTPLCRWEPACSIDFCVVTLASCWRHPNYDKDRNLLSKWREWDLVNIQYSVTPLSTWWMLLQRATEIELYLTIHTIFWLQQFPQLSSIGYTSRTKQESITKLATHFEMAISRICHTHSYNVPCKLSIYYGVPIMYWRCLVLTDARTLL